MTATPDFQDVEELMVSAEACDDCEDPVLGKMCWFHKSNYWMLEGAPGARICDSPAEKTYTGKSNNARYNGWERGFAYESRPGGFQAPILNETGNWMRNKEFSEKRHEVKAIRDQQINS